MCDQPCNGPTDQHLTWWEGAKNTCVSKMWVTEWVSQWQGHLLSGQQKMF